MKFDDYERSGWADYAAFGETVAAILRAAIGADGGYRLQQVRARAKGAGSLRKKLEKRGSVTGTDLLQADTLEEEIKDLAGCRVIFYTNSDVNKLIGSGLIGANFEVVEAKLHHPRRDAEDATELYVSNHYLVRLREERLALPEYSRFAGKRCEIQIQTILNHAWAEMAHDTIYKQPDLDAFGARALEAIKSRMGRIARKYLLPAGHEFAKVAADFERLIKGEELFKGQALEAIVEAADNNERADALDTFAESVLPLYDDIGPEYPDILATLLDAASRARATPAHPIETPYGTLPAETAADIVRRVANLIRDYRYVDPQAAFEALLTLFTQAESEDERKPIVEAAKELAKHNLHVWRRYGPAIQVMLIDRIKQLGDDERIAVLPLLSQVFEAVLGVECTGTTSTSGTVTFHRGAVAASDALLMMRRKAVVLLKALYPLAVDDGARGAILSALRAGTRPPIGSGYAAELVEMLLETTAELIEFEAELAPAMNWELRQRVESAVLRQARINRGLQDDLVAIPGVAALRDRIGGAVSAFRAAVDADAEYAIYKVLVGFDVVYPPAWDEDRFAYQEEQEYRERAIDAMVEAITPANASAWHERVLRCAATESNDLATFPMFNTFLQKVGEGRPEVMLGWLDPPAPKLTRFLPPMLLGLQKSAGAADADVRARQWIADGHYLGEIAWFARNAEPFDETLLIATTEKAIQIDDRDAVRTAMRVAAMRYANHPGTLIDRVFLPGLAHMRAANDMSWVGRGFYAWFHGELLEALDQEQAGHVLDALVSYPDIEDGASYIIGAIAKPWPQRALRYFGARDALATSQDRPEGFDAIPFSLGDELRKPLVPHTELVLAETRSWYEREPESFQYRGGRLVARLFPNMAEPLPAQLANLIGDSREDIGFALAILNVFEGEAEIDPLVRAAVAQLEPDDELLQHAHAALDQSGVVTGEFGFVERYQKQLERITTWLTDDSERVRSFAAERVQYLELRIAAETRRAEASVAARHLEYGEDLDEN